MVKRKTSISLDEWLALRPEIAEPTPVSEADNGETEVVAESPTIEAQSEVKEEPTNEANADVAVTKQEAIDWFWSLLATAGYELW